MSWRRTPKWISFGGGWLALCAGYINAVGFLSAAQRGLSHVTGQVTHLAIELSQGGPSLAPALVVLSFFVGAVCSGAIVRREEVSVRGTRYGVVLLLEAALLSLGASLMSSATIWGESFVALAMGMQNALATSYSGAVVRTTHVTGLVTDLGLFVGHALRGEPIEAARLRLLAILLVGFVSGGTLGAWSFVALGSRALFIPAGALVFAAIVWVSVSSAVARARSGE